MIACIEILACLMPTDLCSSRLFIIHTLYISYHIISYISYLLPYGMKIDALTLDGIDAHWTTDGNFSPPMDLDCG